MRSGSRLPPPATSLPPAVSLAPQPRRPFPRHARPERGHVPPPRLHSASAADGIREEEDLARCSRGIADLPGAHVEPGEVGEIRLLVRSAEAPFTSVEIGKLLSRGEHRLLGL